MPKKETYLTVTGKIRYNMTNDYMFRAILQENEKVLRGLVSSLLHMRPEEIEDIHIENPIILGDAIDKKNITLYYLQPISVFLILHFSLSIPNFSLHISC